MPEAAKTLATFSMAFSSTLGRSGLEFGFAGPGESPQAASAPIINVAIWPEEPGVWRRVAVYASAPS